MEEKVLNDFKGCITLEFDIRCYTIEEAEALLRERFYGYRIMSTEVKGVESNENRNEETIAKKDD